MTDDSRLDLTTRLQFHANELARTQTINVLLLVALLRESERTILKLTADREAVANDLKTLTEDVALFKAYLQRRLPELIQNISLTVANAMREGWPTERLIAALETLHIEPTEIQ